MAWAGNASGLALGIALAGAATAHAAGPRPRAPDSRDARIEALEAQVRLLAGEVEALKATRTTPAESPPAPLPASAAAPAPAQAPVQPSAGAVLVGRAAPAQPASSSPDAPSPPPPAAAYAGGASILAGRPSISSPDGRFAANLHAVMQLDSAKYIQDAARPPTLDLRRGAAATDTAHARDLNDGVDFRRARIGVDGRVFGDFEYNVLFDFGGAGAEDAGHIQELWVQYSGLRPFHLRVGAFRPSLGLEDQGSTNGMPFLERPAITDVAASFAGGDFREGVQLRAGTSRWFATGLVTSRTVGSINSTATGGSQAFDGALNLVGRLAAVPFRGDGWMTQVGVHGAYAVQVADAGGPDSAVTAARYPVEFRERPELRVDGTRLVDTGAIDAAHTSTAGVEAAAQAQNWLLMAEYTRLGIERRHSALADPTFSGWYVTGSWVLTGERRAFNPSTFAFDGPPVDHPFDWRQRTWGAWELAMRYSDLDLNFRPGGAGLPIPADGVRGGEQRILTAGVNWYLNPIVRLMLDYQHVEVDRLSPSASAFQTPAGAQVGQTYSTLSLRSQMAF